MKILIIGAGKMGSWLADELCINHETAIYDKNLQKMKYVFKTERLTSMEEIEKFSPELLINAVDLNKTIEVFNEVSPYLSKKCIISDIASVKNGLANYYKNCGFRFVSIHPMFGPTFAHMHELKNQHAIIISESDAAGKEFYKLFLSELNLDVHEYSFEEHDKTIAYSLSIPFASTLVFASCMKRQKAPGTTFNKHMDIAEGLLSEYDFLLSEILFNQYTKPQLERIRNSLNDLIEIIDYKDEDKMFEYLKRIRSNVNDHSIDNNELIMDAVNSGVGF